MPRTLPVTLYLVLGSNISLMAFQKYGWDNTDWPTSGKNPPVFFCMAYKKSEMIGLIET